MRALALLLTAGLLAGCSGPTGPPTYASLLESPIRGLTPAQISDLENGSGAGLALAAELNGYPGPTHILEFADRLSLNQSQRQTVEQVYADMRTEAQSLGRAVLDAYAALDAWFREKNHNPGDLEPLLEDLARAEAELRGVHLRAHLTSWPLLTAHQRALYQEFRGYGEADHGQHGH